MTVHLGRRNFRRNMLLSRIEKDEYDIVHVQDSPFGAFRSGKIRRVVSSHSLLRTESKCEKS